MDDADTEFLGRGRRFRRVRTPTVLQMEATECGAASLGIILAYFGRHVPLDDLRVECRVSRDGSNALYIKKTGEKYGLIGKGYKMSAKELLKLRPPFMVFWEMNHFLVVEGFGSDRVYLNDPASGRRTVDFDEFVPSYTGIVFRFEPGPGFRKGGKRPHLWRSVARRVSVARPVVVFAVLAGAALMAAGLVSASFNLIFVDRILVEERRNWIRPLLIVMGLTVAFRAVVGWAQLTGLRRLKASLSSVQSAKFLWHVLRLPAAFYQQRYAGDIASRVDSNSTVADLVSGQLATTLIGLLMIAVYAAVMAGFDPTLAVIGVALGGLNLAGVAMVQRVLADENLKVKHFRGLLAGSLMRAIQTIETIKSGAAESEALVRLTGHQARITNASQRLTAAGNLLVVLPPLLSMLTTAAVLWVGGGRVVGGVMSVGALVAFQTLVAMFQRPIGDLVGLGSTLQTLQAEVARLEDVQLAQIDPIYESGTNALQGPDGRKPPSRLSGHLQLRNVTFGYNRTLDEPLIQNLSLEIRPGCRVALVGLSGSGKSTVGRLVVGLERVWSGEILYDGFRLEEIPRVVFTDQVALVDDQTFLFNGTVRENLTLWDESIPDRDVTRAATDAAVHRDVVRRSGGYLSRLSEGARNLSGGQRQRLEIARALIRNPALLVLDEATSALDPVTEAIVDDNLRRRGCTCLIIAHRLSTIRDCDEIVVLRQGKVIQRGTHDELMAATEGFYYELQSLHEGAVNPFSEASSSEPPPAGISHNQNGANAAGSTFPSASPPAEAREVSKPELMSALEPYCETVTTAGNRPLPLDDPGSVWVVTSGNVDLFYVHPVEGHQVGTRKHLCRVEEGGAVFGLDGVRGGREGGLLAVGVGSASLLKFPKADLLRQSFDPELRREVAGLIDDWIDRVSRPSLSGDVPPGATRLESGETQVVEASAPVASRNRVLWVREPGGEGGALFRGDVFAAACPLNSRLPLSPHTWMTFPEGGRVIGSDTESFIENGDPWEGLRRFHRLVIDAIASDREHEMSRSDVRRSGLQRREGAGVAEALANLARHSETRGVVPGPVLSDAIHPLLAACRLVAGVQGIELGSTPASDFAGDPLRLIARASGFRTRRVRLSKNWWKTDGAPMLGASTHGRPVALLPGTDGRYVVVDPAEGTRIPVDRRRARELKPYAIVFTPTLSGSRATFTDLVRRAPPSVKADLLKLLSMGVLSGLLGLVVPYVTAVAVDDAIPRADHDQLTVLCTFLAAVAFAAASFQAIQALALARIRGKLEASVLAAVWDRLLNLPTRFFSGYESGDLAVRALGIAHLIESLASSTIASLLVAAFSLSSVLALFVLNWRLGLVAAGLLAVAPLATLAMIRPLRRYQRELSDVHGEIAAMLFLMVSGVARIRVAGAERRAFIRWADRFQTQLDRTVRLQAVADYLTIFSEVWPVVILLAVIGAESLLAQPIGVGEFLAFNSALAQATIAIIGLGRGVLPLLTMFRDYERLMPILETAPEVTGIRGEVARLAGAIRLDNVSFRYNPNAPLVLDGVSLQVLPGEFVAIVGPSGSGKSTILRLLLGFEAPESGTVSYDGSDLPTLDVQEVRRQIGVVLQDAHVRPGDLYSNIVGLATDRTHEDAWEAAELAGLADDIAAMPMGLHTVVSEGGGGLSSGQRQRLMIARALAGRPRILLFDEATSALDNRTQAHVSRSIHSRLRGTTRVAVAHRLSTVVEADRIYVLSGGKIVQSGRYAQLIGEPGPFRELALRQTLAGVESV